MDEGVSLVVEEVRAADTELDFGESITEREVYRVIFNGKVKSDTTYLLVGDQGIKSCAMLMKGEARILVAMTMRTGETNWRNGPMFMAP